MIEPIHSLAFSIEANRGVYAVLFGSGLSRSAQIPTGWDITLDLVRRYAALTGTDCGADPTAWYFGKFSKEPDYSELLHALAKTPTERQQLLRQYWEPTDEEREQGAKQPTKAHRAIADLVAKGFVRVIVTTNFDRLMELALQDVGVTPTVLSSPDQIQGAMPLIHTQCCVFKVHGDYLDSRIRNTPNELSSYPAEFDSLLDRIFDEFGLIVCGWSADWDEALRRAIVRAPSRRFATYWAVRGEPSKAAKALIEHRGAQYISITDADNFFDSLKRQVEALEEFSKPHPLSTAAAVASVKKFMSEPRYRIQHADLVEEEVTRVLTATAPEHFPVTNCPHPDAAQLNHRVEAYASLMTTISAMAAEAGRWADESSQDVWVHSLQRLSSSRSQGGGFTMWLGLERFPAMLLLYSLGLEATEKNRLPFLQRLLAAKLERESGEEQLVCHKLPSAFVLEQGHGQLLEGMEKRRVPLSDWLCMWLKPMFSQRFSSDKSFELAFDTLEILMALNYATHSGRDPERYWVPVGAFGYRHGNRGAILKEIEGSIANNSDKSPYVTSKLFGNTVTECNTQLVAFKGFMKKFDWY